MPKQERSVRRVERMLDATAELVSEHGVNGFAFRNVAERVGAAQGTLYRFFPTREAALHALHERYARQVVSIAGEFAASLDAKANRRDDLSSWHDWVATEAVARFGPFYKNAPSYSAVRRWAVTNDALSLEDEVDETITHLVGASLRRFDSELTAQRARELAYVLMELSDALLTLAVDDDRWAGEAVHALAGYLDRAARR